LDTATRASTAVHQVSAFSRRQQTVPTEIDLNAVVLELAPLIRRGAGHGVLVRTALEEPLPAVHADPALLEQALISLVVTAGDALQHRGVLTIETAFVHVREGEASWRGGVVPGAQVHLRLMVSSDLSNRRVNDADVPTSTEASLSEHDLGMSLATVREIVRQSGGTMLLGRSVGQAVVYTLSFPAMQGWPATVVPSEPAAIVDGSETILLIEDNAAVREVARAMLRRRGYQVLEAQDGAQAAQIAETHEGPIALVLADVLLPGGSGYVAATALRERHPAIRILLMSGAPDRSVLGLPETTEPLLWLEKPFTESTLAAHVRAALNTAPTPAPQSP
jgi:CheY-like chemotaxis protein